MRRGSLLQPFAIALVAASLLTGFRIDHATPAPPSVALPVKLGMDYLTKAQQAELWKRADQYALAEAFLRQCDKPSNIEQRFRLAVQACIEPGALSKVAVYFRSRVVQLGRKYTFDCNGEKSKELVATTRAKLEKDVAEARSMCQACFFC